MAAAAIEMMDELRLHSEQYGTNAKAAFMQLQEIWHDLAMHEDQQSKQLRETLKAVDGVWKASVDAARNQQQQVRDSIQQLLAEMMEIKEALGGTADPAAEAELALLQGSRNAHNTLAAWQQDVEQKAKYWQKQKLQRVAEYEDLQARIGVLRRHCGLSPLPAVEKPDIRRSNMEFLKLELERLAQEKERREDLLRSMLDELQHVCSDIGEDAKAAATEVHPNLPCIWDEEAAKVVRDMYKLSSNYAAGGSNGAIDLSDSTISKLSSKLSAMKDLKAARAAHAADVLGVLHSLWDATNVGQEERAHFVKLMSGSLRLHARSLEKCQAEVRRLEGVQTQQMLDMINERAAELRELCADSHVAEPPGLAAALSSINSEQRNPGAAADLLAKLFAMLSEVKVLTGKRAVIIEAIKEVQSACAEDDWLSAYETDEQRYKGRDANKKLQRAIRAGKLRERLPAMIGEVRARLTEWHECEGSPFLYDGKDYEFEVLDVIAADVEEAAAARAAKAARSANARRQSTSGGGASLLSPGKPAVPRHTAGVPPRPSSACSNAGSPGGRRADGPATPIPLRGVSSRTLQERHSICVLRSGRESVGGPASLSRSAEVRLPHTPKAAAASARSSNTTARASPASAATGTVCRPGGTASASTTPRGSPAGMRTPTRQQLRGSLAAATATADTVPTSPSAGATGRGNSAAACAVNLRASTSSKLDTIFRRSSVQHPVAKLDSSAAADAGAPGSGSKRGRVSRGPGRATSPGDTLAADQDRGV